MARHDSTRKPKKDRTDAPDPDLLAHIQSLGLSTVEDYLGWCARHGFSRRTDKHWRVRLKERSYANRVIADARLAQKRQELKRPEKVIERIFSGELHEDRSHRAPPEGGLPGVQVRPRITTERETPFTTFCNTSAWPRTS